MAWDVRDTWRPAQVVRNRPAARGSMWITIEAADDLPASYEPGHVLGLCLERDGGYLRHAYTISRSEPARRRFEHLYRVIPGGRMTRHLAELRSGAPLFFHGPFHTPIQREIQSEAEGVILMATGVGIGPLFGYAEKTLREGETRPVTLYAGFREEADICLAGELDALAHAYRNFESHLTLTRPSPTWRGLTGRVTESVPGRLGRDKLKTHHFHLVGNGEMVHLVRKALLRARIAPGRISIETYFNHHAEPPDGAIEKLAASFMELHRPHQFPVWS